MSDLVEAKLPKGRKWTDEDVIIVKNKEIIGGRISFYPVGDNLYTKGLWVKFKKAVGKTKESGYSYHSEFPTILIENYKALTAVEVNTRYEFSPLLQGIICMVWRRLGLRQGYMVPLLRDLK